MCIGGKLGMRRGKLLIKNNSLKREVNIVNVLERLLPAINPEKPLQNDIWSFTTQGARGFFRLEPAKASGQSARKKSPTRLRFFNRWIALSTG